MTTEDTENTDRPTPETDAAEWNWYEDCTPENEMIVPAEFARKLERERDELREQAAMWKANHDNQVALKAMLMERPDLCDRASRIAELIRERDEAREQRDRLAGLAKQFVKILDITEESDGGRLFHPTNITSCRAGDLQKIGELIEALRRASNS